MAEKEYIVTLKNKELLENFYKDMELESNVLYIPNRPVKCVNRRPISRNTHYLLSDLEAKDLINDIRVESVNVKIKDLFIKELHSSQTAVWSKSTTNEIGQKNWGLYRSQLDSNLSNWGSNGNGDESSTVNFTSSGKNVDIIVVDEILYPDHSEFSGRVVQYDWFNEHDLNVKGNGTVISLVSRSGNTSVITTSSPNGLNDGAVVNINCTSDPSFNATNVVINQILDNIFTYPNTGPDVAETAATGNVTGVYQYPFYNSINNHATAVAGVIAGTTQGWARDSNLYNIRHDTSGGSPGSYTPLEYLIDYIREFHNNKSINPSTGRKNPTVVNNSWGLGVKTFDLTNPETGYINPNISKINFRGSTITSANPAVDTGFSGVFSTNTLIAALNDVNPGSGHRIVTTDTTTGTVNSITYTENGTTGLTQNTDPTSSDFGGIDLNDDAYWTVNLPFPITYLNVQYNDVYIGSNSYVTFGLPATSFLVDATGPNRNKIHISAGDRYCQSIWTGEFGTTPNRTYKVRWEGFDGPYSSIFEPGPNVIWEMTFYENTPNQIDLHIVSNAMWRGEFSIPELESYGIPFSKSSLPIRDITLDADITDAINDGIIFVSSAGNTGSKIDVQGGQDYDNYFIIPQAGQVYYNRGTSPGNSHPDIICVGAIDSLVEDRKYSLSNTGPGVDVYAPGVNIMTSIHDTQFQSGNSVGTSELTIEGGGAGTSSLITQQAGLATLTATNHGLSNGDVITVEDCSNSKYNVVNASVTVYDSNTIIYTMTQDPAYDSESEETLSGTIKVGYLYEKFSNTSLAAAQVSGLLALALEKYPYMTPAQAKEYIIQKSKRNQISDTAGGFTDTTSLQNGNNKFAFYHKERNDKGFVFPQNLEFLRPQSGLVFPRKKIRKK